MGSTYETLLVAANLDATVDALRDCEVTAVVVPLAPERVAVLPEESDWDTAPVRSIGEDVSVRLGRPALAMYVFDSDLVRCYVIRDGEIVHTYISDAEALGLSPQALTTAYRHCDPADFPSAVVLT